MDGGRLPLLELLSETKNKLDLTPLRLITAMRTLLTLANVAVIHVARLTGN